MASALIIVADGMGGHAGNVANNMAVQSFNKYISSNHPTDNPAKILRECVIKANDSIKETPALASIGCTMVAAILEDEKLWWASVSTGYRGYEDDYRDAHHSKQYRPVTFKLRYSKLPLF